jgi:hypothetical protein
MLDLIDDEILSPTNRIRKQTADRQSRNETSLSKPIWTDDDEQINTSDERTSTSQSILFRHQNSSNSTTAVTPIPTLPQLTKKSSLPSTTQQFYHHHKPLNTDQQQPKSSPRPLIPLTLSKYRRIPSNVHSGTSTQQQQTFSNPSNDGNNNHTDSFNEHLMINKRIEILKTPGKRQSPVPSSSINTNFPPPPPPPPPSKRSEIKSVGTPASSSSSMLPMDSTKVTIGKSNKSKFKCLVTPF